MLAEFGSATQALAEAGVLVDRSPLQAPASATTVRVRNGETLLTDGPSLRSRSSSAATKCSTAKTSTPP
jgi:hypothetical protein